METSLRQATGVVRKSYVIRVGVTFLYGMLASISYRWAERFQQNHDVVAWLRFAVLLLPWMFFALYLVLYRRFWRPDELELLINYRALAFAFYGLMIGVIVVGQLQSAGIFPAFVWTPDRLVLAMCGSLLAGIGWSKRRYL